MTNEEKIDILVSNYYINESDSPEKVQGVRYGAEKMAEYKDNILREERKKAIERFNKYYDNKLNHNVQERMLGIIFLVDKLLGEDSSDKVHCAFTTMD